MRLAVCSLALWLGGCQTVIVVGIDNQAVLNGEFDDDSELSILEDLVAEPRPAEHPNTEK